MFDQVKVNQNSLMNLTKLPDRENHDNSPGSSGKEFFSMIMNTLEFGERGNKIDSNDQRFGENRKTGETEQLSSEQQISSKINSSIPEMKNPNDNQTHENRNNTKENGATDTKNEISTDSPVKEVKDKNQLPVKEVKDKEGRNKNQDEETSMFNQLNSDVNIKNIMEILKSAFSGNKKAENDSLQKLFNNLKMKPDRENSNSAIKRNDTGKNIKNAFETGSLLIKDLKDIIGRELLKTVENRKTGSKQVKLSDSELKELAVSIIENIKKNRAKDIVKHEVRTAHTDENRNDKKSVIPVDQPVKKTESRDDSSFDRNWNRDKNQSKDNFSYNNSKIDVQTKSALERFDYKTKMPDFKENLQEVIDKARITIRDNRNGAFTVRLNPQELGNVNVNLVMENGVITGKFLVDNEDVKSMLVSSLNDLKYQLEEAGISVGDFSVNVNDQREKYLRQKDDESLKSLQLISSERDVIAAADQYNSGSMAYTGHINMVI